ncbi:transposase IS200 family protein [Roseimicrobium gellanilyticum]|uniref:Transposase IS200 family protein n=1 Tax=Roseimicrobium gellanilyticum TaxID=748857 RepID=A0A366H6P7_9BACT|nr:transposase [Roseimicrobium gellanilyticum]RBP36617.1 transposase IS200 family protein [Roseimicrobium gellanilyticum]
MADSAFSFFDPVEPITITRGHLPHWDQTGATYFITWRTLDSLPLPVWNKLLSLRAAWLRTHKIDAQDPEWRWHFEHLSKAPRLEFARLFSTNLDMELDACHGACLLRRAELARIVADSLHHFEGARYTLGDYIIMPNHVHLLVGGMERNTMLAQMKSWKRWTSREINRHVGRSGRLWQDEGFDHLVRSEAAFKRFRRYMAENPVKAKLRPSEYLHWVRPD